MRDKIVTAVLGDDLYVKTSHVFQYDYGLTLMIEGIQLPAEYEIHFSNKKRGVAKKGELVEGGAKIPDEYLRSGDNVYAWVYIRHSDDDGYTVYSVEIPVVQRSVEQGDNITIIEHNIIDEAIAALEDAVEKTDQNVKNYPYINEENHHWMVYDAETGEFVDTGVRAEAVDIDPTELIDDTADAGVLDKTWSANKISSALEDINSFDVQIVQELPTENIKTHTIYFVPKTPDTHDIYDEYIYVNNSWELIGSTEVDISSKADKTELHITPIFTPGNNLGEYVCNLTFQEVYDAATSGKCDGCIMSMQGVAMGLELVSAFPNGVSFGKTMAANGNTATATITYKQDGTVVSENVSIDIFRLFAKTYAFNTGLFPVKAGDYCINENKFYKANTDIAAFEVFNSSKWDEVTVASELKTIASNSNAMIATIEEDNTSDYAYAVGDIFVYNNKLYKATSAIAVNDYILPNTNCVQTTISSALDTKEDKPDLIVTYTVTLDFMTGNHTATCDKTVEEIGQAYDSGKKIEVIMIVAQMRQKADLTVMKYGNMYACIAGTTFIAEGTVLHTCVYSFPDAEDLHVEAYVPLLSGTDGYTARNSKITQLANPTASTDAANKDYVDTALATKEDKPFTATFTVTYDSTNDTWEVTCDKTVAEVGAAYDAGKTITAIAVRQNGPFPEVTKLTGNSLVSMSGQYVLIFSGRIFLNSLEGCVDINITGATGLPTWQVVLAPNKIDDVQINGTSVISNNVANIPLAASGVYGVVKTGSYGVKVTGGVLATDYASENQIKAGSNSFYTICPYNQHRAVFWGLAKAAGDATQSASSNEVGEYTDEALKAIRKMLGIPNMQWELINDVTVSEDSTEIRIDEDQFEMPFKLRKLVAIFTSGPSTTGTKDSFYIQVGYTNQQGNGRSTSAPSITYVTASSTLSARVNVEAIPNAPISATTISASSEGGSQNLQMMTKDSYIAEYITSLRIYQSGTGKSLIPSGANLKLYGIRYDD